MPKLILIKHSLSAIDPNTPAATWKLAAEGIERCAGLANALTPYLPAKLVSSLEPKAQATAAYLAQRWAVTSTAMIGLEEQHRSSAPFLSDAAFQQTMQRFFTHPSELVFGEETAAAADARFANALDAVLVQYPDENIMVVTHGTVMSLYLSRCARIEAFTLWAQLGLPSFVVFDQATQSIDAIQMNIT